MDWSNNFEQFLNQVNEGQRQFLTNLTAAMPGMQSSNTSNMRQNFDNALKFQEQAVTSSLELQALLGRLSLETQKQFWQGYFSLLRGEQSK